MRYHYDRRALRANMRCLILITTLFFIWAKPISADLQSSLHPSTHTDTINPGSFDVLYGGACEWDGVPLFTIDPTSGASVGVGPTGLEQIEGLAINSQGEIFAVDYWNLYRLDGETGWAHLVGFMESFYWGMAFDRNDVLYAVTFVGELVTVDTATGAPTVVGMTGVEFGPDAIAFDPTDGSLYMSHRDIDAIYMVDPQTADTYLLGFTDLLNPVRGLAFDAPGFLYGLSSNNRDNETPSPDDRTYLILIDKTNGKGTIIGLVQFVTARALALAPTFGTGIDTETLTVPNGISLEQNTPNPFNPITAVSYRLPSAGSVELTIYNALGQKIRTLVDEFQSAGPHWVEWEGRDDRGVIVSSGVYLYRLALTTADGTIVKAKKMTFLK
ncbi:MAG: hypothetical protein JSW58_09525 [Candidatus Latescibacterota bacterium]|nr:MAG: hypothetical protein JSW58_09525 [Candidatus Latescibacterota bacterium]